MSPAADIFFQKANRDNDRSTTLRPSVFVEAMKLMAATALVLGIGVLGCAGDAPASSVATSTSALTCEPFDDSNCDPVADCDLGPTTFHDGQYVTCLDGIIMFAWATPDCRWCINRDVCNGHGGPTVCPFE